MDKIIEKMKKLQNDYLINLKLKNTNEMNQFIDSHFEKMLAYNQRRINWLKKNISDRELFIKNLNEIHKSNQFFGRQCYCDRIEVLRKIYLQDIRIRKRRRRRIKIFHRISSLILNSL